MNYLELEVKEEKILKAIENSPTVFTLGEEQTKKLKEAGASDQLIEAIRGKSAKQDDSVSDVRDFVLILDCSGSMKDNAEPGVETRIVKKKVSEGTDGELSALDRLLIKKLSDKDVKVRAEAAKAIGERKLKAAIPALVDLVSNELWTEGAHVSTGIYFSSDASKSLAVEALATLDKSAMEKAILQGMKSKDRHVKYSR